MSKKITFVCEIKGCNSTRTSFKSNYDLSKHHFCSGACSRKGRNLHYVQAITPIRLLTMKARFEKYFEGVNYGS